MKRIASLYAVIYKIFLINKSIISAVAKICAKSQTRWFRKKSTSHVILNEVRMKNLSQLSTRFFPDESGLPQNDIFGSFYETIKQQYKYFCFLIFFAYISSDESEPETYQ